VTSVHDISWRGPAGGFDLRVGAIITRGDAVLLCTVPTAGCWFVPGGRVRLGEPSEAAMRRELAEELGHELPAGRLVAVMENIYLKEDLRHEIGLYYHQEWPAQLAADDIYGGTEPDDEFRWVLVTQLAAAGFQPAALIGLIADVPAALRYLVSDRRAGPVTIDGGPASGPRQAASPPGPRPEAGP
jgi:ADP-ribose pyrophosphatase YjhB (NUDIX family)